MKFSQFIATVALVGITATQSIDSDVQEVTVDLDVLKANKGYLEVEEATTVIVKV